LTERQTSALAPARPATRPATALLAIPTGEGRFVSASSPDPTTADGYLRLTAQLLLDAEKQGFHTVGVLSAIEGEGKTTAAINLGVCLGRTRGRTGRVLLVDGDPRSRALTRMLYAPEAHRPPPASDGKKSLIVSDAFRGGDLLLAPPSRDGLTLSAPSAWASTLDKLKGRYRYIVVDCPAVLQNPEAMVLRECVERLVLVVRAGKTTRRQIERALGKAVERVMGVIVIQSGRGARTRGRGVSA